MSISHLLTETCTITKRRPSALTDEYGNPIIAEVVTSGVRTHMQETGETIGTNGAIYSAKLYLDVDTDILSDDQVLARNRTFWVNGVIHHKSPTGAPMPYISVELRETQERKVTTNA